MVTIWRVYWELLSLEYLLLRQDFAAIHEKVRTSPVGVLRGKKATADQICHTVDLACVFYFKEVRCLQRSAVMTRLLRKCGIDAEMVIGVQQIPFRAHAWVEMSGRCVNDKPYIAEMYLVIDRC